MNSLAATPSAAADQESCRPDGLYETPGVAAPNCSVYEPRGVRRGSGHSPNWPAPVSGRPDGSGP